MTIRTLSDLNAAYDAGRFHVQRFLKNAGTAHENRWADATFSSGQPGYDAHVGTPLQFTPCVAQKNDAIYFPGIQAGQERYLHTAAFRVTQGTFNGPSSVYLFDLLGYYPLIDGDSTDLQEMDNTASLPRFADGQGVCAVIVCHVAPSVQDGIADIVMTGADGVQRTVRVNVANVAPGTVATGSSPTVGNALGALALPNGGSGGVRSIDSITYLTPPSGLHCIYLIRPLGSIVTGDNNVAAEKDFFIHHGCAMPRIHDGAWLGWFDTLVPGSSRTTSWWGNFTFVWG